MILTRRAAEAQDETFLFMLHTVTMREYVVATWGGWDEAAEKAAFHREFSPADRWVIQADGRDVGVIWVQNRIEELFLVSLELLPEYQRQGIGTWALQVLIEEGRRQRKPVALQVLKVNLPARALYQRLGFGVTGENDTHYILANEER